jgi:hypothetical protein
MPNRLICTLICVNTEKEHKRAEREREERLKEREDRIRKREELKHKKDLLEAKMESRRLAKEQQKQQSGRQHHWNFDCPCGLYGQDVDDGRPMMECEQCNTWVHIPCINRRFAKNNVPIPDWDTIPYMCEYCASGQERPPPSERRAPKEPSAKRVKRSAEASDNQEQNGKLPKIKLVISPRATEM